MVGPKHARCWIPSCMMPSVIISCLSRLPVIYSETCWHYYMHYYTQLFYIFLVFKVNPFFFIKIKLCVYWVMSFNKTVRLLISIRFPLKAMQSFVSTCNGNACKRLTICIMRLPRVANVCSRFVLPWRSRSYYIKANILPSVNKSSLS